MIEKKNFTNEPIGLDGKHFIRCKLTQCLLIYAGGDFSLTESQINECQIRLDGPAVRTANFLVMVGMPPQNFVQQPPTPQGMPNPIKGEH